MEDFLLKEFFNVERWQSAIDVGVGKKIDKAELRALTKPETRIRLYQAIASDNYAISPPRVALIPKDNGEFREVMICENIDRIVLSIINNMFFELFPEFVHDSCKSYRSGIGCGKVVKEASAECVKVKGNIVGKKYDLKKYFDRVKLKYIDALFNRMEQKYGRSKIIDIVRDFYHCDLLFDADGNLIEEYKSIKQGTATSSFMADALLYHIDEELSKLNGIKYWRYSDDILILGENYEAADLLLKCRLAEMELQVNEKKEEVLDKNHYFKFLGFSICDDKITLSKGRLKDFQKEVQSRTVNQRKTTPTKAINSLNNYLYKGNGQYAWATSVLPIINVQHDIDEMNEFILDCIRGTMTGKGKVGGLGYVNDRPEGVILRGTGKNVKANRDKTPKEIDGFLSLRCMQNALLTNRAVYETLVRSL